MVALLALAGAAASLVLRGAPWRKGLSLAALFGTGVALAASGHASSAPPQWLTRPAVLVHGVAVAYWIGALAPLAVLLRRGEPGIPKIVRRFSDIAVPAVAALVITGAVLAWIQVRHPAALLATAYGRILTAKLAPVVVLSSRSRRSTDPGSRRPSVAAGRRSAGSRHPRSPSSSWRRRSSASSACGGSRRRRGPFPIESPAEQPAVAHISTLRRQWRRSTSHPGRVGPTRARVALSGSERTGGTEGGDGPALEPGGGA